MEHLDRRFVGASEGAKEILVEEGKEKSRPGATLQQVTPLPVWSLLGIVLTA